LVDHAGDTAESTGIRELKEETGYTVTKILGCSTGKQFLDPGLGDDSIRFLFVEVDGNAEENLHPKQVNCCSISYPFPYK
jgi:8-oxo-dGTP pyrophosphatase MutT (NUDIX family)